ncbi:MAG: Phosphoglucosamine mutase [Promethearchaeota archaeon]|nr:MAG: Phosphoglucosamine mutase [Candidatus Lokiarchaeota archaeon]
MSEKKTTTRKRLRDKRDIADLSNLLRNGRIVGRANFIFTPELAAEIGVVHGSMFEVNESIVFGRDYHNDSRMLKRGYSSGFMSTGSNLLNLSDCTFPLLQFTIRRFGASGGIYFSGGHLYSEDVGIRLLDSQGIEISPSEIARFISLYNNYPKNIRRIDPNNIGKLTAIPQTEDIYIKSLQQFIDRDKIKKQNLKIVVDCSYGPTGRITPLLLNEIGVETIALNTHYRQRDYPVPNIRTIRNTADIVKASNSHLGVCFDVDGSRSIYIDENGLEIPFEDLLMLFISYDDTIQASNGNEVLTTPALSSVVRDFIEENGFPVKQVDNYPGELSRQIRQERACFAASDTLKFYFPEFAPFSDGNFTLIKLLKIMTEQEDLISTLTRGFPKGIKVNKTIPSSPEMINHSHNRLREIAEEHGYEFHDIINELKIIKEDVFTNIKIALYRDAILLSAESDDTQKAKDMIAEIEQILVDDA